MSSQLRRALDKALQEYALARVPCLEGARKVAILSMTAGWDGQSVERAALYTLDIEEDAGDAARAVDLSGQGLGLHLQEVPLWDVFQRLTCTAALWERDDWKPWDGDERLFHLKWMRGTRSAWRRWASGAPRSCRQPATRSAASLGRNLDALAPRLSFQPSRSSPQ